MKEIEFNLLTEPWVRVRRPDNTVQEVSLTDALLHAQDYVDLAGISPASQSIILFFKWFWFAFHIHAGKYGKQHRQQQGKAAIRKNKAFAAGHKRLLR